MNHLDGEKDTRRGPTSFCVPRAAIYALLREQATVYDICSYLTLARFTDKTGCYSTASVTAVNRYTGANKTRTGPVARALERIQRVHAKRGARDLGPIVFNVPEWMKHTGEQVETGSTIRSQIRYVLPDFNEPLADRVWFGGNLVSGVDSFDRPLKALKNAGDLPARVLLLLYAANDMEAWGGVSPRVGPSRVYAPFHDDVSLLGGARFLRWQQQSVVVTGLLQAAWRPPLPVNDSMKDDYEAQHYEAGGPLFAAIDALESIGLIYEIVLVLNRAALVRPFHSGPSHDVPGDAEPLYVLDTRSHNGYKPKGEEGLAGLTARTAGEIGLPVTDRDGGFNLTYAAIVPDGCAAMVAGIFRLRFRVANPKNAGVKHTWANIGANNREAFRLIQRVRAANGLAPADSPFPPRDTAGGVEEEDAEARTLQ